jgi:hypothetical protein
MYGIDAWPKVYGHLLVKHLIPKSWALICSWSLLFCYNSLLPLFWEVYPQDFGTLLRGLASIQPQEL